MGEPVPAAEPHRHTDPRVAWPAVACELVGTFALVVGGTLAVCFGFYPGSPLVHHLPDASARLLITGTLFAGTGALVTVSPLGRRSGAHLNPAMTLAFLLNRHLTWRLALGYVAAQVVGALAGAGLMSLVAHRWVSSPQVYYAVTHPGDGTSAVTAVVIEGLMTAALVLVVFGFVSSSRTARWTPFAVWVLVATLVWREAPRTGTSLNPARSLGPDAVAAAWTDYGVYVLGPLLGAAVAVLVWVAVPRQTLTAKLFHDPRYPSVGRSRLPAAPATSR